MYIVIDFFIERVKKLMNKKRKKTVSGPKQKGKVQVWHSKTKSEISLRKKRPVQPNPAYKESGYSSYQYEKELIWMYELR